MKKCKKRLTATCVTLLLSLSAAFPALAGEWKADQNGWWYQKDGGYPVSCWDQIDGKWYYFNQDGYMQTGIVTIDGEDYSFNEDGSLKDDYPEWKKISNYYVKSKDDFRGISIGRHRDSDNYVLVEWSGNLVNFLSSYEFDYVPGKMTYTATYLTADNEPVPEISLQFTYDGQDTILISGDQDCPERLKGEYIRTDYNE